jgi:hypothetical protein
VADPQDTKLWFASKELLRGTCLRDHLGKNEKTKVVVKVASKQAGQPAREPVLSQQDERMILMQSAKRRDELEKLEHDADDSYHDAPHGLINNHLSERLLALITFHRNHVNLPN